MTIGTKDLFEITRIVILDDVTLRKQFTILIHAIRPGTQLSCDIRRMLALVQVNLDEYYCTTSKIYKLNTCIVRKHCQTYFKKALIS